MKNLKDIQYAWAIRNDYKDINGKIYSGFKGLYNFVQIQPECVDGNRVCLFRTRKLAREYNKKLYKNNRDRNKIVKVLVEIRELTLKGLIDEIFE